MDTLKTTLARTLRFNRFNKWSIGLNPVCLQAIWVVARCLLQAVLVCIYPRDMTRNPVRTSKQDWHGQEEEEPTEWRHFDTSSQICSLNCYTWSCRVHEHAWVRSVMLIFVIFNVFHNTQSIRNTFLPNSTTTLPCTRSPNTVPHERFCTWERFFDRLVCIIQNNQLLDALIKFVS